MKLDKLFLFFAGCASLSLAGVVSYVFYEDLQYERAKVGFWQKEVEKTQHLPVGNWQKENAQLMLEQARKFCRWCND